MSRCKACDVILGEYELKRIDKLTGFHVDLCNVCYSHSNDAMVDDRSAEFNHLYSGLSEKEFDTLVEQ